MSDWVLNTPLGLISDIGKSVFFFQKILTIFPKYLLIYYCNIMATNRQIICKSSCFWIFYEKLFWIFLERKFMAKHLCRSFFLIKLFFIKFILNTKSNREFSMLNPLKPSVAFLSPLKTSEKLKVFWCFQGV